MDQLKTMSRSSQLLAGAGLLHFIFLFFDWQQVSVSGFTAGRSGWHGWGTAAGIAACRGAQHERRSAEGARRAVPA